jgi:protein TonB
MRLVAHRIKVRLLALGLFRLCLIFSITLHGLGYAAYFIGNMPGGEVESSELKIENVEVDFEDIPPELIGGTSSPAAVEKKEWIEGSGEGQDAPDDDVNFNALSGDGTDRDGYLYSFNGDRPPTPIIDFDLRQYFPREAKFANISSKTVVLRIQVDEAGKLKSARVVSGRAGYGFDEAAMKVIHRVRFAPGYVKGKPTKMAHELPIRFVLE